jgi:hypothetical protein
VPAPADPIVETLLIDLRRLRRMPGELGVGRFVELQVLTDFVGAGSIEQANSALVELQQLHGSDPESDVGAYFFTAGLNIGRSSLDQRLKQYAEQYSVDPRTALRRSDRGAVKLSTIIRHSLQYDRPWCRVVAVQSGPTFLFSIYIELDVNSDWRRPRVSMNGTRYHDVEFTLKGVETNRNRLSSLVRLPGQALDTSVGGSDPLVEIGVTWAMPIWPSYDVTAHLADNRLTARLITDPKGMAEIQLRWATEAAAESRDNPLAWFPTWL